jgi:hypothetical protein
LISKPIVFIKGIPTRSQLEHYCDVPAVAVRNWTRGRFTLRIHIAPASLNTAQVGVYAKFEGMPEGVLGTEWVVLASKGLLEDGLLRCIQQRTRGIECTTETR